MDTPEVVQPDEGQGATGGEGAPYAEYLNRIPEQVREQVEPVFKEWDGQVTKRFQEASEYKKSWEPYESLGVNKMPVDEVSWLMQFREVLDDPQAVAQWYEQYAQEAGLNQDSPEVADDGFVDPDVSALFEQQLEQRIGPLSQQLSQLVEQQQQQEQQVRVQAATQHIEEQLTELAAKHGDFPRDMVEKFIANYIDSDPENAVTRAHADWQALVAATEKQLVSQKLSQPAGAESGGAPDASVEPITSLKQAAALAGERMRIARQA